MKSRKNFAKTISIATTLITLTFFAFGCGEAKTTADTPEETEKATEIVSQEENEKTEPATEVVAEEETEATEQETEEVTDNPILFRVVVSNPNGAYVGDQPSDKEYSSVSKVEYGEEFDVYKDFGTTEEEAGYYAIKMDDGLYWWISKADAQVIE